jgi:ribosomal protein S27AE
VAQEHLIARLGGWVGYEVVEDWHEERSGQSWWILRLQSVPGWHRRCSHCGEATQAIHDQQQRRVRDLPIFEHRIELILPRLRVACCRCGPKLEHLDWLDPYARVTRRRGESVAQLCRVTSVRHVAAFFGLDWKTVKELDFVAMERRLGPVDLDGLEVIGMDEFAISVFKVGADHLRREPRRRCAESLIGNSPALKPEVSRGHAVGLSCPLDEALHRTAARFSRRGAFNALSPPSLRRRS